MAPATCAASRVDLGILGPSGSAAAVERLPCSPLQGGLFSVGNADAPLPCWGPNIIGDRRYIETEREKDRTEVD